MTVPATARRAGPYSGNGVTTSFSFSFKTFAAGDLQVTKTSTAGIESVLVLNSDYTVTLNVDQDASPGGSITYPITGSALASGEKLTIVGDLEYEQTTDLLGGGAFNARVIEDTFDRTVIQIQQLEERADRTLVLPVSASGVSATLPTPDAGKVLGWNATEDGLVNVDAASLASVVASAYVVVNKFTGDGATTQFVLTQLPGSTNAAEVTIAGVMQNPAVDYTVSGSRVVFTSAPPNGAVIIVRFLVAASQSSGSAFTTERKVATSGQTVFTLDNAYAPGADTLSVFVNGLLMTAVTDYAETSANVVTFTSGLTLNDEVVFHIWRTNVVSAMDAANVSFSPAGAGAVTRTAQSKMRDTVSVLDFGADPTGASDSRAAFQAAVNAVIAAGRGTVYVPDGTYLINGTTSSDSILNGVLFPWDNNYDLRPYLRLVGDGGVTIKAGSNSMAVFRVSTTFVEISGICIDGNGKTNVTGIGVWPENTGNVTLTSPVSQSYFVSHSVTIKNCYIGMDFQPGVTDTTNRQSGCFYHSVYNYHGNTNTQHLVFSYPYDYNTAPSGTNQNYTTRSGFYNCSFVNGNVGIYAKGVGDVFFYNTNVELINSTSNARGTAPLATPTGVYVSSQGTFAKIVQMFGGYIEACTETLYNGRTNGVATFGTVYTPPATGNFRNIVKLDRNGLTLAFDSANANVDFATDAGGGLSVMADPGNAKAATFLQMGMDGVYGFALQPYIRASGPSAVPTSGNFHGFYSADASNAAVRDYHTGSSGTLRLYRQTFPNLSPNDTSSWFQFAEDATESKFIVWSNGTCQNRTGTFSAISDIKLKQDIAAAPSYWDKFKAYEFVSFAFKTNPSQKMLGVIAQQIEQVSPGLVYETPDYEKVVETNEAGETVEVEQPTGTATKAVKQSIMAVIAQTVLQEAQKRIEELEAKVSALEAK